MRLEKVFLSSARHDDDPAISIPLLLQTAIAHDIPIRIAIASDGSQGYCTEEDRPEIIQIRRKESENAYGKDGLGLDAKVDLRWFHFKDTRLADSEGRFLRNSVSEGSLSETTMVGAGGYTGLEDAMVKELRDFNPKVVIMPTPTDLAYRSPNCGKRDFNLDFPRSGRNLARNWQEA